MDVLLPKFDVIRQVIDAGLLGELRAVIADNGEFFEPDHPDHATRAGRGPLNDLGTYPVALATALRGAPEQVLASGQLAPSGVIGQASVLLAHTGGNQSVIHTTQSIVETRSARPASSKTVAPDLTADAPARV